jgi:hypothetical protein
MNKMLLMLSCITAYSFLSAMEQQTPSRKSSLHALDTLDSLRSKPSPRQSSPRSLTIMQPDSITSTRPRVPSNPIIRVKSQPQNSEKFLTEENIGQKSETAFNVRKRGVSDGK